MPINIGLTIHVDCDYERSRVHDALLRVFSDQDLPDGSRGLLHPDNFTFGQPVYISAFYAAAQQVQGVERVDVTAFERQDDPGSDGIDQGYLTMGRYEIPRLRNDCGCCEKMVSNVPVETHNRPGLAAVQYRVGTHASFKERMIARLASSDYPQLKFLKVRDDDDFTIALLDAWATSLDVLSFYQERIANGDCRRDEDPEYPGPRRKTAGV